MVFVALLSRFAVRAGFVILRQKQACGYSPHYGRWPSLLLSCSRERQTEGKMSDWVPVLFVALVVVCVTAYLLLDPKFRPPKS
jgi:hypothetical protein